MSEPRGEFTRRFDRNIMKDESAAVEELQAQRARQAEEEKGLESEFKKLQDILDYRAKWLHDRFKNVTEDEKLEFRGRRFHFPPNGKSGKGSMEFRARLTDTGLGITLESTMSLEGRFGKRFDYVNFPKAGVDIGRAKKFIENKLLEFAAEYAP